MAIGEYLTTADVAEKLGLSESRIRQFVMQDRLHPDKIVGRMLFFTEENIANFAEIPRHPGPQKKEVDKRKRRR